MKAIIATTLLAALACGCTFTTATAPGYKLTSARLLMNTGADATLPTTNGTLRVKLSTSPNAEALGAVAEGVAKGITSGVKP